MEFSQTFYGLVWRNANWIRWVCDILDISVMKNLEMSTNHLLRVLGKEEAKIAGEHMNAKQIQFDFVHTSLLTRAIQTTLTILHEMPDSFNGTVETNWLLNERHFGALTGQSKTNSSWKTHWDNRPPPMLPEHPLYSHIYDDPRYDDVEAENGLPTTESLADTQLRFIQHWLVTIGPQVQAGHRILVVAHQNLLRGVIKYFDQLADKVASSLKIKNSVPFIYKFDQKLQPLNKFAYLY